MKQDNGLVWVLVILVLLAFSGGGISIGGKPDQVVFVYEKDDGAPPSYVGGAIARINLIPGVVATMEDDDTRDASGAIADQYKVAFPEATKVGLPALVSLSRGKLLKATKNPTEADFESIK